MGFWLVALLVAAFIQAAPVLPEAGRAPAVHATDAVVLAAARPFIVKPDLPDRKSRLLDAVLPGRAVVTRQAGHQAPLSVAGARQPPRLLPGDTPRPRDPPQALSRPIA